MSVELRACERMEVRSATQTIAACKKSSLFATNMEQAADIVAKDLLGIAREKNKRSLLFSESGQTDLMQLLDHLLTNVRAAASLFMTGDERAARRLASEKATFAT